MVGKQEDERETFVPWEVNRLAVVLSEDVIPHFWLCEGAVFELPLIFKFLFFSGFYHNF